jgi:hypothetical protein
VHHREAEGPPLGFTVIRVPQRQAWRVPAGLPCVAGRLSTARSRGTRRGPR